MNFQLTHRKSETALTRIEVIASITILAVLMLVAFSLVSTGKDRHRRIACIGKLKQVGLSFLLFAEDHGDLYPMQFSTNGGGSLEFVGTGETFRHFLTLSNELYSPLTLLCPADDSSRIIERSFGSEFNNRNLSYFVGIDATSQNPGMILAGDRHLEMNGQRVTGVINLPTNQSPGWINTSHQQGGNIVLGDGSVQQVTTSRLGSFISDFEDLTNRLSIPD